jgi:hypothetical protein
LEGRTWGKIQRVIAAYPQYDIKAIWQPGEGTADAVFATFDVAQGDVLMILDADLMARPNPNNLIGTSTRCSVFTDPKPANLASTRTSGGASDIR